MNLINVLLDESSERKVILWLGELCEPKCDEKVRIFRVGNSSVSTKAWEAFSSQLAKFIQSNDEALMLQANPGVVLNGLRHGLINLVHFTSIVITDLQSLLKRHYRDFWTECDTYAIFCEFYWPLVGSNPATPPPKVVGIYDHTTHIHIADVSQLHTNKVEGNSLKSILQKLCLEFNICLLHDLRKSTPTLTRLSLHQLPHVPLCSTLRSMEKEIRSSSLLRSTLVSIYRQIENFGKDLALAQLHELHIACSTERDTINPSCRYSEISCIRQSTWTQRLNEIEHFILRLDSIVSDITEYQPPSRELFDIIYCNHFSSSSGSALVLVETRDMARNLKVVFQAYLASSGINNWIIDATSSEKDLLDFSARQEKAIADSVHSILICPRSLIQRRSIPLTALELLVHVGHLSKAADLVYWLQFIDDRATSISSHTARLIIACQPQRRGQTKDTITQYEMLSRSDFDISCGSYFEMFGLHQNTALYQQQRLESGSLSRSRHQIHTVGTFSCSLDAMWQVVHRYLHCLADSDLRSGNPTKLQWSSPTKMSSHDASSSPLYIISATLPIHAAVGPHFKSSPQPSLEACKHSVIQSIFTDLTNANALNMHMSPSFRSLPSPHSTSATPNRKLTNFRQPVPKLSTPFDTSTQDGIKGHVLSEMLLKLVWKEGPKLGHLNSAFLLLSAESLFSDHPINFECLDRDHVKYVCSMETIGSLFVSNEQLEELKYWHTKLFGLIKLSSTSLGIDWNNSSHKYLIVPCELFKTPDGMLTLPTSPTIDWKVIKQTRDGFERDDWQLWPGSYVYYEHAPDQRYLVKEIDFGRSPRSPCRTHPESTIAEAVFLKHKKLVQDLSQPLAKVKLVSCKPFNALLRQANLQVPKESTLERRALAEANPYQFLDLVPELLSIFIKTCHTPHESILILPSLLYRLEAFLRTQHFYNSVGLEFVPLHLALTSLTTASAIENTDLEVLETVGDMVLKLFVHTHIVFAYPRMTRRHYEHYRQFWISNKYQCQLAVDRELDLWMNSKTFCGNLFLPGFCDLPAPQMPTGLTEKHVADCMEAIIGACYQAGGLDGAAKCLQSIGLGVILFPQMRLEPLMKYYPLQFEHIKALEDVLGYEWIDKSLVLESLSHESFDGLALPSFHRLGLIGDALCDHFLVVNHAAKVMPNASPGDLTYLKSIAVCGHTQSVIAHRMGLAGYLLHRSPKLAEHLSQFSSALNAIDMPNVPFWRLSSLDHPEALPMCLEAIVGAVFVDSGFNIDITWRVFEPHFAPFWNLHVRQDASFWPKTTMANLSIRLNCSKYTESPARRLHLSRAFAVETQYHHLKAIGIASSKRIAQSDAAARLFSIIIADKTPEETLIDQLQQYCSCQTVDREEKILCSLNHYGSIKILSKTIQDLQNPGTNWTELFSTPDGSSVTGAWQHPSADRYFFSYEGSGSKNNWYTTMTYQPDAIPNYARVKRPLLVGEYVYGCFYNDSLVIYDKKHASDVLDVSMTFSYNSLLVLFSNGTVATASTSTIELSIGPLWGLGASAAYSDRFNFIPDLVQVVHIASSATAHFALTADGTVYAWGRELAHNSFGLAGGSRGGGRVAALAANAGTSVNHCTIQTADLLITIGNIGLPILVAEEKG